MVDAKFVESFNFNNVFNIFIGCMVFASPWIGMESWWNFAFQVKFVYIALGNLFLSVFIYAYFVYVCFNKHSMNKSFIFALRRFIYMYVLVIIINTCILLVFGRLSVSDLAFVFSHAVLSAQFVCLIAGLAFDLLMFDKTHHIL